MFPLSCALCLLGLLEDAHGHFAAEEILCHRFNYACGVVMETTKRTRERINVRFFFSCLELATVVNGKVRQQLSPTLAAISAYFVCTVCTRHYVMESFPV